MKRKLAMLMCMLMILMSLTGCGKKAEDTDTSINASQNEDVDVSSLTEAAVLENTSYVMIYNPYVFDESDDMGFADPAAMSTGDFSSQIVVGMNRAGDLGTDIAMPGMISQAEINENVDDSGVNREGVRAEMIDPTYALYDTHAFYHPDIQMQNQILDTFTCSYVGEYCYIWTLNGSISEADAQTMGQDFDAKIYLPVTTAFGPARFTENGGKVNFLIYPIQDRIGGFFTTADIYSSAELPEETANMYGFNTDHAIVHINSQYVTTDPDYAKSTMAHELQHQICASNCFNYYETPLMETWLNEGMSAVAEELVYPGIKEAGYYNQCFYLSNNYRTGQSLYNFDVSFDEYIGAYGVVYLFTEYLQQEVEQFAGESVFYNIHDYWRNSYSADVTAAEALANAVPTGLYEEIDSTYTYPEKISMGFDSEYEEWLSKMTLDFYIQTLSPDLANLTEFADQVHSLMLYSEINPAEIEGGGRIVIATQNSTYEIPADADPNLIYVGLDANFNPVDIYTAQQ